MKQKDVLALLLCIKDINVANNIQFPLFCFIRPQCIAMASAKKLSLKI